MYSKKYFLAYTEPITIYWANTEPLQNHCQKTKYTEQCSVYRTGWQHCKCVKLLFPKVLKTFFFLITKKKLRGCVMFLRDCVMFLTTVTNVIFKKNSLRTFGKSNLTHLTTNVMFSGQRFAILAMFFLDSP